ncbi:MAG: hypothetical protein KatS3mg130_1904 [Candidatus Sumerlaea sp.]|nr:MAG: hypothetical protein KatS3mg130_1904 [Candidatus Sumerlaea sp.]
MPEAHARNLMKEPAARGVLQSSWEAFAIESARRNPSSHDTVIGTPVNARSPTQTIPGGLASPRQFAQAAKAG